MFTNISSIFLN